MRRLAVGFALFFASAATSCAFLLDTDELKEGSGEPTADPVPLQELPAALGGALCGMLERCMGPAMATYSPGEDCTVLQTSILEDGWAGIIQASVDKGRVQYSPEHAGECVESFSTRACADFERWPEVCDKALAGQVPLDGECATDLECVLGAYCDTTASACPGTCRKQHPVGDSCSDSNDDECEDGLECFNNTCMELRKAKEQCGDDTPECEMGQLCFESCLGVDDVFARDEGQLCNPVAGLLCMEGLHCVVTADTTGTCETGALSGGQCSFALPDPCGTEEYCDHQQGMCVSLPGPNDECREPLFSGDPTPVCLPYHRCLGGTCYPLRRLDEECVAHGQCYSGYCEPSSSTCKTVSCEF